MSDTQLGKQCLTHYNPQHIQVRKDFLDLCAYDKSLYNNSQRKSGKTKRDEPNQECMAKILRLLETLTDSYKFRWQHHNEDLIAKKRLPLKEPAEYRIELAYSTIVRLLYNTYGESTVRNSMAALIQLGYVVRYQKNKASVPYYALNIPVLQAALHDQKEQTEDEVLNVTPSDSDNFLGDDKMLNVQAKGVNVTPKPVHSTAKGVNSTPDNIEDKKASNTNSNIDRSDQPIYSPEEKQILDWYERLGTGYTPKPETAKKSLPALLEHVHSFEDMQSLYDFTAKKITGEDKTVYLANMTKFIKMWLKNKPVVEAPQPEMPELTAEESEEEVLWTSRPSTIERLFAQQATMEEHMRALDNNLRMMSRSEAREYGYDMPVQHYSAEQVGWYRLKTMTRELARIAG